MKNVTAILIWLKKTTQKNIDNTKKIKIKILDLITDDISQIRLIKPKVLGLFYLIIFIALVAITAAISKYHIGSKIVHPAQSAEIIIGISSVLLALLLPVAILIIQDSKEILLRRTVVKNIIELDKLPIVVSIIACALLVPSGVTVLDLNITAKTLSAAIIGTCFIFIVLILLRSYKWLSDGSEASGGFPAPPNPDDENFDYPEEFKSYRFAQIVRFLNRTTSHEAWTLLWKRWWPPLYDKVLHEAFIRRHTEILEKEQSNKYFLTNNELKAYRFNIHKRILEDFPYSSTYLRGFLNLYALMHKDKIARPFDKGLYAANNMTSSIIREIVGKNLDKEHIYFLLSEIENYVETRFSNYKGKTIRDPIVVNFVHKLLDAIFEDKLSTYDIESKNNVTWGVTYENTFVEGKFIPRAIASEYWTWFKSKVKEVNDKNQFGITESLAFAFPESDSISLGYLFWYLYLTESLVDEEEGLKLFVSEPMPFTLTSNSSAEFAPVDDERNSFERFRESQKIKQEEAIKIFGSMFAPYLLRVRDLNRLINLSDKLIKKEKNERKKAYLSKLQELFMMLKDYYVQNKMLKK